MKYLRNFNSRADWESALILDIPNISYIKDSGLIEYGKDYQIPSNYILYTTTYGELLGNISNASKHYLHDGVGVIEYANPVENSPLFNYNHNLKSIRFPKGTKKVSSSSFYDCWALNEVDIPEGVTDIEDWAFAHCYGLKEIILPDSISHIASGAFYHSALQSIKLPANLSQIASYVFENCNFSSITIPESVVSIGEWAFDGCSKLTSVTIPNSVTSIGKWAFENCSSLTSVTIGNSVTSIGDSAFLGCSALTSIVCEATTPPTLDSGNNLTVVTAVYVPAESVGTYKTATNWSYYADKIQSIS